MDNNNTHLSHALALASKRIYVHPLRLGAKEPLTENGYLDATIDEAVITNWWTKWPKANIGTACKQSGIVIVDIDRHPGRPDGLANFRKLEGREQLPKTVNVKTPDGYQYWFKAPEGVEFNGNLCKEVQLKHKGYGIAPPSVHPSGQKYKYINPPDEYDIAPLPKWMYPYAIKPTGKNKTKTKKAYGSGTNGDISDKESEEIARRFKRASMPASNPEQVIANCAFLKHCVDDAETLTEPEWYHGTVGVLSFCENGTVAVHKYSEPYPQYSYNETQEKMKHRLDDSGPSTCSNLQEQGGNQHCKKCPFNGKIKSPIVLGYQSQPVEEDKQKPVAFPVNVFPAKFADYALAAARSIRCPVDYTFCVVLAVVSILLGKFVRIKLTPEWYRYPVIWLALVGPPGYKKTPAIDVVCINVLKPFFEALDHSFKAANGFYEVEYPEYSAELQAWKKEKSSAAPMPIEPVKPQRKQLTVSDITIESLCEILPRNSSSLGMVVDEMTFWFRAMSQYKGGKGGDRSHWLSIRNNMPIIVNRKGQEPHYVETPFVTVVGGIQPDLLSEVRKNEKDQKDGFFERISYTCPNRSTIPVRDSEPIPDDVKNNFFECAQQLYGNRSLGDRVIELSPAANEQFLDAQSEWEDKINSPDFPSELEGFYSKASGQLGELILILHEMTRVAGETDSDVVAEETVTKAKQLTDYFLAHGRLALGLLSASREERQVEQAVKWIRGKCLVVVKARDFLTNKVAGCKKKSDAINLLKAISDFGWGYFDHETNTLIFPTVVSKSAKTVKAK